MLSCILCISYLLSLTTDLFLHYLLNQSCVWSILLFNRNLCFWVWTYKLSSIIGVIWNKLTFILCNSYLLCLMTELFLRYLLHQTCVLSIILFNHNLCFWVWIEKLSSIIWVIWNKLTFTLCIYYLLFIWKKVSNTFNVNANLVSQTMNVKPQLYGKS